MKCEAVIHWYRTIFAGGGVGSESTDDMDMGCQCKTDGGVIGYRKNESIRRQKHMWTCPKCGRSFKRQGQDHYCGKAPETIDEYIEAQPEEMRQYLRAVRDAVRPSGISIISYISRVFRNISACIRDRRRSWNLLSG